MTGADDATLPASQGSAPSSERGAAPELGERYDLGPVLGRGGMGEVRLARDTRIDREVAVKLMRTAARDDATLGRFFREARVQGVLEHPAVVPVHDLGIDAGGNPYFVMKRLTGTTLADVLGDGDPDRRARWPRRQLLARLVDVCLAIEFAHTRGVIHRDLKPANIMLGDFGEAYVLDWGLARTVADSPSFREVMPLSGDGEGSHPGETKVGDLLGTPGYMSPEQARGETVDPRTDTFALGCVLFEILVGKPALPRGIEALQATLELTACRPSAHASDVPVELDDLCARATAADPTHRPSARALADGLQAYLDGDRDLAQRRELAAEHVRRSREALVGSGEVARATAMREAGRALALDPENPEAADLLGHLLLDAPESIPPAALVSADLDRARTRQRVARYAGVGFLGMLPTVGVLPFMTIRHAWPIVATAVMTVVVGCLALIISRRPLPMRSPSFLVLLACNCALIAMTGLLFAPLLFMPIFLMGSLAGWLPQSTSYRPWILLVAHALPLVVLVGLEQLGVLPVSLHVVAGDIVITPYALVLTPATTFLAFTLVFIVQASHITLVTLSLRNASQAAQDRQHAQAWHLRQLLPGIEPRP